jgi:hypothetical protein
MIIFVKKLCLCKPEPHVMESAFIHKKNVENKNTIFVAPMNGKICLKGQPSDFFFHKTTYPGPDIHTNVSEI